MCVCFLSLYLKIIYLLSVRFGGVCCLLLFRRERARQRDYDREMEMISM